MPHVASLPSYFRDTLDLIKHIEGCSVPQGALLVTLDVEALYSSFSYDKGVQTIHTFLMKQSHTQWKFNAFLLRRGFGYIQWLAGFPCIPPPSLWFLGAVDMRPRTLSPFVSGAVFIHIPLWDVDAALSDATRWSFPLGSGNCLVSLTGRALLAVPFNVR